jgi:molybdopterin synthase sulfur carrier subunit
MTAPTITLHLRFFASLREALGAEETLSLAAPSTVGQVRDLLIARGEPYAGRLARQKAVRTALDQVICQDTQPVTADGELAFFPPVTGG